MACIRQTPYTACRRTKPSLAGLCSVGKDTDPDTGVPLGTRTTLVAGFAFAADSAIQADYGCRTGQVAHDDCEW